MKLFLTFLALSSLPCLAQGGSLVIGGWQMQDMVKVSAPANSVSEPGYVTAGWYKATVPGTVLTTLVDNKVYPEPLYGENMRAIPESLNKTSYWYRTDLTIPASYQGRHTWLHFAGINYSAEIWINGRQIGSMRGAFLRGDFDITELVKPAARATIAVLVSPEPHPGVPHEHTVKLGTGHNGGETAIDGPTFLSTIGWDWIPAVRDRDTGIWLPVTLSSTGPVVLSNPAVTSALSPDRGSADLAFSSTIENRTMKSIAGKLVGSITGDGREITFVKDVTVEPGAKEEVSLTSSSTPAFHIVNPKLWWPNGYGDPNLYKVSVRFEIASRASDEQTFNFGIRKVEYEVPDSENLTIVVNGVKVMIRGGDWGMDEAMKRISYDRLDAQFHMHALAHLNMIRNWVGQSTSPDFYDLADKYGILLWDEFFQPNPGDGPNVTDIPTYLANVTDKVLRYRNHPSIVVWCARNEGKPPEQLDKALATLMARLDPMRLYQSSSTDGRGVSSHGPYYWRAPRFFYQINEAFKTETGSVSIPTIESIQGMMPERDWETINDDWAQHDMAAGAQRGDEYPFTLARRYGPVRNLADFVRKGQMANYEAFRAMYESRNSKMFRETTGILTWMSEPAQPSFVWQLYHHDLEPNSALYATQKAAEMVHVQMNEADRNVEVINNQGEPLHGVKLTQSIYRLDGTLDNKKTVLIDSVPASTAQKIYTIWVNPHITELYFVKLDLTDPNGKLLSTNFYWQNVAEDDYAGLMELPPVTLSIHAQSHVSGQNTVFDVTVNNPTANIALLTHLQLHQKAGGRRVLPVFYSDNYLSLAPGESRALTIEAATKDLASDAALLVDGYNVNVTPVDGPVAVMLNQNAQPLHWPASNLVPTASVNVR